jgi:acetylglutamate kinase
MIEMPAAAQVLTEALPYIKQFRNQTIVVKAGGRALADPVMAGQFAADVVLMHSVGMKPIVVHGGGPQITELMARLGKKTEFRDGHRVTDAESLDITRMVLVGKVSRDIVAGINRHGRLALGVSGEDAGLLMAEGRHPDLGYVGDIKEVNPHVIERLLAENLIPVISTIGSDPFGQAYNINADLGAAAVAVALGAQKLVYLTDVEGLYEDVADPTTLVGATTAAGLEVMLDAGGVTEGMVPKIEGCLQAVRNGVPSAHILSSAIPHALLVELFTDQGIGTMITPDPR